MYKLSEKQAKFIINILENTQIQGTRKDRKAFDKELDEIIVILEKPSDQK